MNVKWWVRGSWLSLGWPGDHWLSFLGSEAAGSHCHSPLLQQLPPSAHSQVHFWNSYLGQLFWLRYIRIGKFEKWMENIHPSMFHMVSITTTHGTLGTSLWRNEVPRRVCVMIFVCLDLSHFPTFFLALSNSSPLQCWVSNVSASSLSTFPSRGGIHPSLDLPWIQSGHREGKNKVRAAARLWSWLREGGNICACPPFCLCLPKCLLL